MGELNTLVFGICGALLAVEVISKLFPDKSGELVRGLAVLSVLAVLLAGAMRVEIDFDFEFSDGISGEYETVDELAAESGIALLRERLQSLLDAAGIETAKDTPGVEVRYRQSDTGEITIERVCIWVRYGADIDRAAALLRSVLTEAIPLEVYAE